MDRRRFLKVTAITGASAALASCGHPENQIIRFVPDDEFVPGIATWKPSICPLCPAGCGLHVRVLDADVDIVREGQRGVMRAAVAKKLEGLASHPVNRGALCARGQAAIQVTYHPDRLRYPMKRTGARGSGQYQEISWDDAIAELVSKLDALVDANRQSALAYLSKPRPSHRDELMTLFLQRFGARAPIRVSLLDEDVLRRANAITFGQAQLPTIDLAQSRFVLAFGADFLGTWNSPVAQAAAYGAMRQGTRGQRGTFVQVESRMSQTGANADEWIPTRPGTEGALALGLAHVIVRDGLALPPSRPPSDQRFGETSGSSLSEFSPSTVEGITGVPAAKIEQLARSFAAARPAVAIIGGPALAHTNALAQALAVNALNGLVGSIGIPGGVQFTPRLPGANAAPAAFDSLPLAQARKAGALNMSALAAEMLGASTSAIDVVLLDEANPVFLSPKAWKVREALERVPFIASFGSFLDETSILADLILPDHSFLESWVDAIPESGAAVSAAMMAEPVMRPLHSTRSTPDVVLDLARRLKRPLSPPLEWENFEGLLKARFAAVNENGLASSASAASPLRRDYAVIDIGWTAPHFDGNAGAFPFHLLPYASAALYDGSTAHLPWLQEMPDPMTSAMWSNWVEINPRTAERLQINTGDMIDIASQHGSVRAPAVISPGIAPDIVAMPLGQGHEAFTRYASGRGSNPIAILAPVTEPTTGSLAWAATRVRLTRVSEGNGELTLFAGADVEHPHQHR